MGRKFNNPIHVELATQLKIVEKKLADKYGGSTKDSKIAGDNLQLTNETFKGGRRESSTASFSMHTFGLAMDVNYVGNPYLGGNISSEKTLKALKKGGYISEIKTIAKIKVLNKIFGRAGLLINGTEGKFPEGYTYSKRLELYDKLSALNKLIIQYFNLMDNSTQLKTLIDQTLSPDWGMKSVDDAIAIIKTDWDWFCGLVSRYDDKYIQNLAIKKSGFLNLDRRFVEELGLDWGATYGDIMHFDMRNKCVGKTIADSRG